MFEIIRGWLSSIAYLGTDGLHFLEHALDLRAIQREELLADGFLD